MADKRSVTRLRRLLVIFGAAALIVGVLFTGGLSSMAQGQVDPATLTAVWGTITAQAVMSTPLPPVEITPAPPVEVTAEFPAGVTPSVLLPPPSAPSGLDQVVGTVNDVRTLILARADLELAANQAMGDGIRPESWSGLNNGEDPQMALLLRLDLELLYGTLLDINDRPRDWIGAVGSTPIAIARDARHDIELLADTLFGRGTRPEGWSGGNPLLHCNRATQALVQLLMSERLFTPEVNLNAPRYCHEVEVAVTRYVETNLLVPREVSVFTPRQKVEGGTTIQNDFTVAWLDSRARQRLGVVPNGTVVEVQGRSMADFSKMILVRGPNFNVFIEYTNTDLTAAAFSALPDAAGVQLPVFCEADWC